MSFVFDHSALSTKKCYVLVRFVSRSHYLLSRCIVPSLLITHYTL